jgi:hypothetical protein
VEDKEKASTYMKEFQDSRRGTEDDEEIKQSMLWESR